MKVVDGGGDGATTSPPETEARERGTGVSNGEAPRPQKDPQPARGGSQYQLVFMDELSSESSLAGSLSPQNLEFSGSYPPPPPLPPAVQTSEGSSRDLRSVSPDGKQRGSTLLKSVEEYLEIDENRSNVSTSTLVAESTFSCETADTLQAEQGQTEWEEGSGGKEEVDGEGAVGRNEGEKGGLEREVSPSDVMIETLADSKTPPPKLKEHPLSRLSSDSEAVVTPPFSPLEYHSGEETEGGPYPLPTPSPLPYTESPVDNQPVMSILFSGVYYLGSSTVDAPISETEANRKMHILHEQALTSHPMPIILSVPITNDGSVLLKDPKTDQPLTTFPIKMILFCARGNDESLQDCFCLNVRHKRSGIYHCHVFQCEKIGRASCRERV